MVETRLPDERRFTEPLSISLNSFPKLNYGYRRLIAVPGFASNICQSNFRQLVKSTQARILAENRVAEIRLFRFLSFFSENEIFGKKIVAPGVVAGTIYYSKLSQLIFFQN